ncbi:phytase [Phenylobacterium immobile]|uniref:phytase n=1 Tax=Phenylobacterium immobile TaxID=21 RepID=UPI001FE0D878|nr:phytase [Phenylobacterium immobile]
MSDSRGMTVGAGTPVAIAAETPPVGTGLLDAADDPAIWADPADTTRGVIIGTDKKAGLYVYDLAGRQTQYVPGGLPNNVDLRGGFPTPSGVKVLVAASDREKMGAVLLLLDPATLKLEPWGLAKLDLAEPYGLCVGRRGETFVVIVNGTDGQIRQISVAAGADGQPVVTEERRFSVPSQPEGCVVDDARGRLYLGEEAKGVWRFDMGATATPGMIVAAAPSAALKPDVEGLALLEDATGAWLIVSSQGDSAFAVYKVDGAEPAYRGRFSPVTTGGFDGVTGTDGVAALGGPVGAFPEGLVVMQDDEDGGPQRQNFKLVDWRAVKTALGL